MAKKKKEAEGCCSGGMNKTCKLLTGVVLAIGGGALVLSLIGMLPLASGLLACGISLIVVGLSKICHCIGICCVCK